MLERRVVGLALLTMMTACGGEAKDASSPASDPSTATAPPANNQVKVTIEGRGQVEVTELDGPALGLYDTTNREFHVVVFDDGTDPKPSCDTLAAGTMTKGGMIDLVVAGEPAVGEILFLKGSAQRIDPDGKTVARGKLPSGIGGNMRSLDDKTFTLDLTSKDALKPLSGTVTGAICPQASSGPGALKLAATRDWLADKK